MSMRVKLHGRFRIAAGSDEIEVPDTVRNVGELLEQLTRRLGPDVGSYMFETGTKDFSQRVIVVGNRHSVSMLEGLRPPLLGRNTVTIDSVDIMEVVGGG